MKCFAVLLLLATSASASYLGPLPVQYVNAGEATVIDMHRFYEHTSGEADSDAFVIQPGAGYTALFDPATLKLAITASSPGLIDVPLRAGARDGILTLAAAKRTSHTFFFKPAAPVASAVVAGSFNGWSQTKTPLLDPDGDGTYTADLFVDPGSHLYKLVVDGNWISDPANPNKSEDGFGGFNSILRIEGEAGSAPFLYPHRRDGSSAEVAIVSASPIKDLSVVAENPDGSVRFLPCQASGNRILLDLTGIDPDAHIRIVVADGDARISNVIRFQVKETSGWDDAVIYYAFTDRFADGDVSNNHPIVSESVPYPANFHGGDWAGIRKKINEGYFNALGVNVLWVAPLNKNPDWAHEEYLPPHRSYTGYHGYWPVSPTATEPRFGSQEDLKALVADAHRAGIKVMADLVLNHVHESHPFYRDHPEWFNPLTLPDGTRNLRQWDQHSYTTWFEPFLPDVNFDNPDATRAMLENAEWWAREFDLDGFRLDAVKHIPPDFWRKFRAHFRARFPDKHFYLLGETFLDRNGIMDFVGPNMLDGQFDFPLYDTIKSVFATAGGGFPDLEASLSASERIYGKGALMSPLVGNHDKSRFMAFADGDLPNSVEPDEEELGWKNPPRVDDAASYGKLKMALAFLMTIDGVPMIYSGDEYGMSGAGDPDNRRDMSFGSELTAAEQTMLDDAAWMIQIRRNHPALRKGSRRTLLVEPERYAYSRTYFDDRLLVLFMREPGAMTFAIAPELEDGEYVDYLSGRRFTAQNGSIAITSASAAAMILVPAARAIGLPPSRMPFSGAGFIPQVAFGTSPPIAAVVPEKSGTRFFHAPSASVEKVAIAGSFNGWSKQPMTKNPDGTFEAWIDLPKGMHYYKFVINDDQWIFDPLSDTDLRVDDGHQGFNSGILVGGSREQARPDHINENAIRHDSESIEYLNRFTKDQVEFRLRTLAGDAESVSLNQTPMRKLYSHLGYDYYGATLPIKEGDAIDYTFLIQDGTASATRSYAATPAAKFLTPDWARNAVWYQIMLDRWSNGTCANDPESTLPTRWDWYRPFTEAESKAFYTGIWDRMYGGDLQGMIESLDYLEGLGVNAIYLNPIFEAPGHHKYNTSDYRHVDDNFGFAGDIPRGESDDPATWKWSTTDRLFLDFLKAAHARGFKVILDGVFNHVGTEFWAFQDVARDTMYSPYKAWFDVTSFAPFEYKGWAGYASLPEFAEDERGLRSGPREHLFNITRRWMDPNGDGDPSDGIDGWRLDVPENVNEAFWRDWRKVVKGINPEAYITGEIWENAANRLQGDHHDAVMNYEFLKRVYGFFLPGGVTPPLSASEFATSLDELQGWYLPQVNLVMQNLLSSHDIERIVSAIHNRTGWRQGKIQDIKVAYDPGLPSDTAYQTLKNIVTFQMTWIGAPMIYYGDEVGMFGADDPSNRMPMWWSRLMPYDNPDYRIRSDLFEHYKSLIALRKSRPALRTGAARILMADDSGSVVLYERALPNERIFVAINNGDAPQKVFLPCAARDLSSNVISTEATVPAHRTAVFLAQ